MSLSEELQSVADTFSASRDQGLVLTSHDVVNLVAWLNSATAMAHHLENQVVPPAARFDPAALPPNVVLLRKAAP